MADCDHCGEAEGSVDLGALVYCQDCYQQAVDGYAEFWAAHLAEQAKRSPAEGAE